MKQTGKRVLAFLLSMGITVSMLGTDVGMLSVRAAGSDEFVADVQETVEFTIEAETETTEVTSSVEEAVEQTTEATSEETEVEDTSEEELVTETAEDATVAETTEEASGEKQTTEETTDEVIPEVEADQILEEDEESKFTLGVDGDGYLTVEFADVSVTKISGDVVIPAGVKIIPASNELFKNNTGVTSVTFEAGSVLETIEADAFMTSSIKQIQFPQTLTQIGNNAFLSSDLKKIEFVSSGSAVAIGNLAFSKCKDLETVLANGRIATIGEQAFYNDAKMQDTIDLTGVTAIGAEAFFGCKALTYLVIPDSVLTIGTKAFENCTGLGTSSKTVLQGKYAIKIGNGITELKEKTFSGCSGITEIELPENIAEIESYVFDGCSGLKSIIIKNSDGENHSCNVALTYQSFPSKNGLVLSAYDGTVEDWVGNHATFGVKFQTLYKSYDIKIASNIEHGTIAANVQKAKVGSTVTITVTPDEGYVLDADGYYISYVEGNDTKLVEIDAWTNSFVMPECEVTVYAKFVESAKRAYGDKLVVSDEEVTGASNIAIDYVESTNTLMFPKPWQYARILVEGSNGNVPGYKELVFTSKNTKIATVDEKGKITAVAPGKTQIVVSLADTTKTTKALSVNVSVGEQTYVEQVTMEYTATKGTIALTDSNDEAEELGYDIITFPASIVKVADRTISVTPVSKDSAGDRLYVKYKWTSLDSKVAKPKNATTTGTTATITVPKGATGETIVTMTVQDGSEKPIEKKFIVRVVDDTPRLLDKALTVDPQSTTGTVVNMLTVYDGAIDEDSLKICKKVINKSGTSFVSEMDLFDLEKTGEKWYLSIQDNPSHSNGEEAVFADNQKYTYVDYFYLCGTMEGTDVEFQLPIPSLTIYKKVLKPTAKLTGKINLFYNGLEDEAVAGTVNVKQSINDLTIESFELVGLEKTNGVDDADDDAFVNNFEISLSGDEKQDFVIKRSENSMAKYTNGKSKGKPVVTGILRVKYAEYDTEYDIKITVPTQNKAPSYVLSTSKIKLNQRASGQIFDIQILDKKTKKVLDIQDDSEITVDITEATTGGIVDESNPIEGVDSDTDSFRIQIQQAKKGKIAINYKQPGWETSLKATISVSLVTALPTVKLGKKTLTLNNQCPSATDTTTMILNQEDSALEAIQDFTPTGKKQDADLVVEYEDGKITARITGEDDGVVDKGNYKFECIPNFNFTGSMDTEYGKKITVTVKVLDTTPSIKLKSSTFTLNSNYSKQTDEEDETGYDYVVRAYSWKDLPAGYEEYELMTDEMDINFKGKGTDYINEDNVRVEFDNETLQMKVYVESASNRIGNGSYTVTGLYLENEEGDRVTVKDFAITVKNQNKDPKITVKAKGSINSLDSSSEIVYTPKLSNINGNVTGVRLTEVDKNGVPVADENCHFDAVIRDGKIVVSVKDDTVLEKRSHTVILYCQLSNATGWIRVTKDQKITPKQTMPKLKTDKSEAVFYAGDKSVTNTIKLTQTGNTKADIIGVKFSDKTSESLQKAFTCSYDAVSGKVTVKLVNSAFIKQNEKQTLTFEIVCAGQLEDTAGTTFSLKVTVNK